MAQPNNVFDSLSHDGSQYANSSDQQGSASSCQISNKMRLNGLSSSSRLTGAGPSTEAQTDQLSRRGRRRRSSEFVQWADHAESADGDTGEAAKEPQSQLWWQRSPRSTLPPDEKDKPVLQPLQMQSEAGMSSSPSSQSLRSPAANFLSSMNESLGSPPSIAGALHETLGRSSTISPARSDPLETGSARTSTYGHLPRYQPMQRSEGSPFGLTSAAAELYSTSSNPKSERTEDHQRARSDQEGSRIGVNGRYLLGKTIGFGGFSTIREAWDLGENADRNDIGRLEEMHRVAVKIVYSSENKDGVDPIPDDEELSIWESIPSHPNLLPLLHHEKAKVEGSKDSTSVAFLVMPYCQGSLLTFVKNEGSLSELNVAPTDAGDTLSRSASLHGSQILTPLTDLTMEQAQQNRTGSGFIPRNAGMRVASVPLSHLMGRSSSSVGSSNSLLRRASSRVSRPQKQTNGVPFSAVREVMRQLVDALVCLHCKAHIMHGDLKLENILGQQSFPTNGRERTNSASSIEGDEDTTGGSNSLRSYHDAEPSPKEIICWRIADFGASVHKRSAYRDRTNRDKIEITGGSLAYTAPEIFAPEYTESDEAEKAQEDPVSPFAPDMWALGCILYCLCSGRLPFADSFEPRLQLKIAKGKWEMPARLRRRNDKTYASSNLFNSDRQRRQSNDGRVIMGTRGAHRNSSLSTSLAASKSGHIATLPLNTSDVVDLSASMPALPDRNDLYDGGVGSTSQQSIIVHSNDPLIITNEGEDQEESSDAESDADERIDQESDGTSRTRVQIRMTLRKLLESDPRKRWTIEQMARQPWLRGITSAPLSYEADGEIDQFNADPNFARPNLANGSLSEHTSQGNASMEKDDDIGRGRSKRRDAAGDAGLNCAARPIDIDRSSSRSRSRPGIDRFKSSPWNGENSSFETRYKQSKGWTSQDNGSISTGERRVKRSISADNRSSSRGRGADSSDSPRGLQRSVSRPPRLHMNDLNQTLPSLASDHSPAAPTTSSSSSLANRSNTSRSRSRARDALNEIASRRQSREGSPAINSMKSNDEKLWWQRGRHVGR